MDIQQLEKKHLAVIISSIIGIIIVTVSTVATFLNIYPLGINNDVTLIVEVGVGIIITSIVYGISRRSEIRMDDKITDVLDIVKAREEIQKAKEVQIQISVLTIFKEIKVEIENIIQKIESHYGEKEDIKKRKLLENQIFEIHERIRRLSKQLDDSNEISPMYFDVGIIQQIKTASSLCKNKLDVSKRDARVLSDLRILSKLVETIIEKLEITTEHVEEKIKEKLKSEPEMEYAISVSSDRTVYPLDSTMHMRANIGDYFIEGEKILFEVFNSTGKLLLSKIVDPKNNNYPELAEAGIVQADFKMEGKEWKVGSMYVVKATYGSSWAEDSFLIDKRMPVVQSDKSVYTINGDMILTVIDPDADKDNQVAEFAGDREDSKVIIESKWGKIDGYRLRETGDSTGIFQGIIGVLGVRKDGTILPRNIDGKIIDKIQGTGIEDGFIAGELGEEITISYTNKTGTAYLTIYVANFGAVVEMDQKIYTPNDKVYLTIVAPDFNFDSEIVNEIGQSPESIIRIRTSKDKLKNYKLVETGVDTGIFTGEVQLTEDAEIAKKHRENLGPNDGILYCDKEDFIEVAFSPFGNEEIVGRAMIKSLKLTK